MIKMYDVVALLIPISRERLSLVEPQYKSIQYLPKGQIGVVWIVPVAVSRATVSRIVVPRATPQLNDFTPSSIPHSSFR